jgi:hypothetical protein
VRIQLASETPDAPIGAARDGRLMNHPRLR